MQLKPGLSQLGHSSLLKIQIFFKLLTVSKIHHSFNFFLPKLPVSEAILTAISVFITTWVQTGFLSILFVS